ncbi:helix-turn-helix transcriptional regulator [Paenibacillus chitinolyticus]|uniref:helix-turn-helix transcriptional regulator n=1 Tax=Paenibacillus chitinolyticus TaxID=79263 RepID=UPI0035564555
MSKSKRLMELMLTVNRMRKFTVGELAREFGVSQRTILRDLQELGELGVPLYSEVGPHGGYQVLRERLLPPIAFTEEEAVSIFFAVHALRHYSSLPFETESSSALKKFYAYMPEDVRERIDQMKNRVDFITPARKAVSPYLSILLDAAVQQKVLLIRYQSREKNSDREIQPIGIFTGNGLWYCSAYCYRSEGMRVFRCDRIHSAVPSAAEPLDLRHIHLENKASAGRKELGEIGVFAELTLEGVEACEAEPWSESMLTLREDGTGWLQGTISRKDLPYFAKFFIGLGREATVKDSPELLAEMKAMLAELLGKYS